MRFCPRCGQPAQDQHRFCVACGADLNAAAVVAPADFPAPVFPPGGPTQSSGKAAWLVVVAALAVLALPILAIVAAVMIPTMIGQRIQANEAGAIQHLKQLNHALTVYHDTYQHGYPTDLAFLGPRASGPPDELGAALVESPLTLPVQSGYRFSYDAREVDAVGRAKSFVLYVDPVSDVDGRRHFFLDQSGVIRVSRRTAGNESPALEPQYAPQKGQTESESDSDDEADEAVDR